MLPEIQVLGVTLHTFGLVVALAFVAAGALLARRLRELGRPVDWAYERSRWRWSAAWWAPRPTS